MQPDFMTAAFYLFAAILVVSGLCVITARNPVHAALYLVLSFFTAGALWVLLRAEFLAIAIVLIYVGAVMVLFLFVVMMLNINIDRLRERFWTYLPVGVVIGLLLILEMVIVVGGDFFAPDVAPSVPPTAPDGGSNTKEIARLLFTEYAYPFELASLILLVAMIAAIALTMRKREGLKYLDPEKQVAVKSRDRLRLVSIPVEKDE